MLDGIDDTTLISSICWSKVICKTIKNKLIRRTLLANFFIFTSKNEFVIYDLNQKKIENLIIFSDDNNLYITEMDNLRKNRYKFFSTSPRKIKKLNMKPKIENDFDVIESIRTKKLKEIKNIPKNENENIENSVINKKEAKIKKVELNKEKDLSEEEKDKENESENKIEKDTEIDNEKINKDANEMNNDKNEKKKKEIDKELDDYKDKKIKNIIVPKNPSEGIKKESIKERNKLSNTINNRILKENQRYSNEEEEEEEDEDDKQNRNLTTINDLISFRPNHTLNVKRDKNFNLVSEKEKENEKKNNLRNNNKYSQTKESYKKNQNERKSNDYAENEEKSESNESYANIKNERKRSVLDSARKMKEREKELKNKKDSNGENNTYFQYYNSRNRNIDLDKIIEKHLITLANKPKQKTKNKKFQTITQYKENKGKYNGGNENIDGDYNKIIKQSKVPYLIKKNIENSNDNDDDDDDKDDNNESNITETQNNSSKKKAKIIPKRLMDKEEKKTNNKKPIASRNTDKKNKNENDGKTEKEQELYISRENEINLNGFTPIKDKSQNKDNEIKFKNNPLLNKIMNFNEENEGDNNDEAEEEENKQEENNKKNNKVHKNASVGKIVSMPKIRLNSNKNTIEPKKGKQKTKQTPNKNNINTKKNIYKESPKKSNKPYANKASNKSIDVIKKRKNNNKLYANKNDKFLDRQKRLEIQKNKLKEELKKTDNIIIFLNKYNNNENNHNFEEEDEEHIIDLQNNENLNKNISTISSLEKDVKPKIKVKHKTKNSKIKKQSSLDKNKIMELNNNIEREERSKGNIDEFNQANVIIPDLKYNEINNAKKFNKSQSSQISTYRSLNTKAKEEPLKFISNYYMKKENMNKDELKDEYIDRNNNGLYEDSSNMKDYTVFDIIKEINITKSYNLKNNILENKLSKFKGKILNENMQSSNSTNKDKSNRKYLMNTSNNTSRYKSKETFEFKRLQNNSNSYIFDYNNYNSNLSYSQTKPNKKVFSFNKKNRNDRKIMLSPNNRYTNRSKPKRYNSTLGLEKINRFNSGDIHLSNNKIHKNMTISQSNNLYNSPKGLSKKTFKKKFKNSSVGQLPVKKTYYFMK